MADTDTDTEVLLEINLISAQELKKPPSPSSASIRNLLHPYASLSLPGFPKLRTRVDHAGHANPTWNDRFVFLLPSRSLLLPSSPSALSVEILSRSPYRLLPDASLGSARILLANLRLLDRPADLPSFSAFGIRRRSGRVKGVLNVGFTVLSRVSTRIREALVGSSAVGYRDLMGPPVPRLILREINRPDGDDRDLQLCGFGGMMSKPRIHVSASDENLYRPPCSDELS